MNFSRRWVKLKKNSHQCALRRLPYLCLSYASAQTPVFLPSTVLPFATLASKINSSVMHEPSVSFHISQNHNNHYEKGHLFLKNQKYTIALFQQPEGASSVSNIVCLPLAFTLEGPS